MSNTIVKIEKSCDVKLDGAVKTLQAGTLLSLPAEKAQKLIDAGYAKEEPFDANHWTDEIRSMVADLGRRDPRAGIWQYILTEQPELWETHQSGLKKLDAAFQIKDSAQVIAAKSKCLDSFDQMLIAWENHNSHKQPELLAA